MLPISLFTVHDFSPSTASILGWIYLVTFGSIVGYTAYVWLLANAPLGMVSTYAYVNPVVAIIARRALPRRAADVAAADRRGDRRRRGRDRRARRSRRRRRTRRKACVSVRLMAERA